MKKKIMMSIALAGALCACAKEELLRYPDSARARLVSKGKILEDGHMGDFGGGHKGDYCYHFDLNYTPGTAEMHVYFPQKPEKNMDWPIGTCKTVADVRFWAAQIYSVNTSTPMPEYTKVKGKKVLTPEKCEYIEGLYLTDPVCISKAVPEAYSKGYPKSRKTGRTKTK